MIPYGNHSVSESDISAVILALNGKYLTTGPLVEVFEDNLSNFVGAKCIVVSSGTAALHCAFAAIDIQPGDEIITPPITFIATQATAALLGATIIFADVQPDTGNIDPQAVESLITSRTKAIVAVDYAGHPADLFELRLIANKYNVYLIEDAAHSLGSKYRDIVVGSLADLTTFSFFPTKNITTGEGGAVASRNEELLLKARRFARQGLVREQSEFEVTDQGPWHQEVQHFGLNYRLPDLLCALGISQLQRIEDFKCKRRDVYETYSSAFSQNLEISLPTKREYVDPMWHLYPIRVDPSIRLELYTHLRSKGVLVQVNYMPAYWHPVFRGKGYQRGQFPIADSFYESEISLPMFTDISKMQINTVIEAVNEFFE